MANFSVMCVSFKKKPYLLIETQTKKTESHRDSSNIYIHRHHE